MKFAELIINIEKAKGGCLSAHEKALMIKLWNVCVDCIADEWPVLGDAIRQLKVKTRLLGIEKEWIET